MFLQMDLLVFVSRLVDGRVSPDLKGWKAGVPRFHLREWELVYVVNLATCEPANHMFSVSEGPRKGKWLATWAISQQQG